MEINIKILNKDINQSEPIETMDLLAVPRKDEKIFYPNAEGQIIEYVVREVIYLEKKVELRLTQLSQVPPQEDRMGIGFR